MKRALKLSALMLTSVLAILTTQAQTARKIKVDYKETTLKNGLRVITVEDHSAPVIAISVNYMSAHEPSERSTGLHIVRT